MRLLKEEIILLMFTGLEYSMLYFQPHSQTDIKPELDDFCLGLVLFFFTHSPEAFDSGLGENH